MKLESALKNIQEERESNTITVYMPSIHKDIKIRSLTTDDLKTLSRIGVFNEFDLNNELLKLYLFDKLLAENKDTCPLNSNNLTQLDFLSFIITLRKLLNNDLIFEFTCQQCNTQFQHKLDLEAEFSNFIFNYEPKILTFEKIDNSNNIWKFELKSYSMKNYLYYRYYVEKLKEIDINNPDLLNEEKFLRPVLYISKIFKNDEEIEDWNDQLLGTKIKFFNTLPAELIINPVGEDESNEYLSQFIKNNFEEEKFIKAIDDIKIKCTNPECGESYSGLYTFDDFCSF